MATLGAVENERTKRQLTMVLELTYVNLSLCCEDPNTKKKGGEKWKRFVAAVICLEL